MSLNKCVRCGLVNAVTDETCRRCGAQINSSEVAEEPSGEERSEPRTLGRRLLWIATTTLLLLFIGYLSLLLSSDDLTYEQNNVVRSAVAVLTQKGFDKQAFVLNRLVKYRSTDNWWNRFFGHRDAYAATNFPFEVLTLYPEFFNHSTSDTERAAILLHESYHLFGSGEQAALDGVWRNKRQLGWTADEYGHTRVWNATQELTMSQLPHLFSCGPEGKSDCTE
jgi:hypothetical protein